MELTVTTALTDLKPAISCQQAQQLSDFHGTILAGRETSAIRIILEEQVFAAKPVTPPTNDAAPQHPQTALQALPRRPPAHGP